MFRTALPLAAVLALLPLTVGASPKPGDIKKAFKSGDKAAVTGVLKELEGSLDKKNLATVLKNALKLQQLGVYTELLATLRTADGEALEALTKAYKKEKKGPMRFLIVDALGGIEKPIVEETLAEAIRKDKDQAVRVQSVRLMGKRYTATAVDQLIPLLAELEGDDKEDRLVREIKSSLENLTREDGLHMAEDWKNFWTARRAEYTKPAEDEKEGTKERGAVMERMKKERPSELKTLTRIGENEIIVVDGNDQVDRVLKAIKIKFKKIKRDEYESGTFDPDKQVLIFECPGGKHVLSENGIAKLRDFVAKGGYAFCSDWDLGKTLALAFPNVVSFLTETPRSEDATDVTIQPFPATVDHPLMRDVFPLNAWEGRSFEWKLHQRSHLINDKKSAVIPLVSCPDIAEHGSTTVAFTFAYTAEKGGRPVTGPQAKKLKKPAGRVLFVSSHFSDEKGGEDGYALQQLLLNFIVEKQEQRKLRR